MRVGGADINSYLALAAIIGLGMYGIENKLELSMPPISTAASGPSVRPFARMLTLTASDDRTSKRLPADLKEATDLMAAKDSYARKVFGDAFVDHFTATRVRLPAPHLADAAVQRMDDLLAICHELGVRALPGAGLIALHECTRTIHRGRRRHSSCHFQAL